MLKYLLILAVSALGACALTGQAPEKVAAECTAWTAVKAAECAKPGLSSDMAMVCALNVLCPPAVPASGAK